MILQSTSDKIEIDIFFNNVLTNPTSIIIREIRDPNGNIILTNVTPTAGSTTGRYEYTLAADKTGVLGVHTAIWRFVISGETFEHTQYFEVVSSLRQGYVSPYEVRQKSLYEKITTTSPTDEILQKYIDNATDLIDSYLGGSINYAIYTEERRCILDKVHNGIHVQLSHRPIISLTSIQLMQGPTETLNLDVDYIRINKNAGYLEYFSDIAVPTLRICVFDPSATQIIPVATVVYTAGYITIPDAVKRAAVMIIEELYKKTNGEDIRLASYTIDSIKETYKNDQSEENAITELGLHGARAIKRLLNPYRQGNKTFCFSGPLG